MTITKTQNGTDLIVAVEGRLDTLTAPDFENEMKAVLDNVENVTLDFANLEYISSAGLRALLLVRKALYGKGEVKIINANDLVKEVFEVTGFINVLDVQ